MVRLLAWWDTCKLFPGIISSLGQNRHNMSLNCSPIFSLPALVHCVCHNWNWASKLFVESVHQQMNKSLVINIQSKLIVSNSVFYLEFFHPHITCIKRIKFILQIYLLHYRFVYLWNCIFHICGTMYLYIWGNIFSLNRTLITLSPPHLYQKNCFNCIHIAKSIFSTTS